MAIWALVTGASEGLGREFAILAAKSGFDVILSARQEEKLQRLAHELHRAYHVAVEVIPADLSDPAEAERLWTEVVQGREIGVFINNAGLGRNGAFADPEGWPREAASIGVNVVAATALLKGAVTHMSQTGSGHILNVASLAGVMPGPQMAVYHATKAYLLSLSEALSSELKGSGIRVTALCPGVTDTAFFDADGGTGATIINRILPMANAEKVALAGWQGMEKGRRIVVPGVLNRIAFVMPRVLPRQMVAALTGMLLRRRW
ncbi:SDR family NAD(P)-dependent oxidoreductase [Szabonella alba]|uniref:SDR family oxidoreductase n=1 Tax=Szabonella alba TaxID=2804194 RepID=A0A8K0VEL7_9RHOB|nr:SDR family oxidoreductase [Szabonella alba]MBL4917665.1 SDR family oxidoreductase [Szabonella alba]